MKTKHFIWMSVGLLSLLTIIVTGNIIVIGDKLGSVNIFLKWGFYVLMAVFIFIFIIIPIFRVILTPEIKGHPSEDIEHLSPSELSHYIKRIKLTADQKRELLLCNDRRVVLRKILGNRKNEMESIIKKNATAVFVITAISQNGSIDMISSIGMNFRMINSLIKAMGYRPSYLQLIKMYISVFSASIIIASIDDILDDIDFGELCGKVGIVISNILTRSAANGAMNAFVCLKVGYATIKYLELGGSKFEKEKSDLRKTIRKEARRNLIDVTTEGMKEGKSKLTSIFR